MEMVVVILQVLAIFVAMPVLVGILIVGLVEWWHSRAIADQDVAKREA